MKIKNNETGAYKLIKYRNAIYKIPKYRLNSINLYIQLQLKASETIVTTFGTAHETHWLAHITLPT